MSDDPDDLDPRQAMMRFDDSPDRFRQGQWDPSFSGSSGVLFEQAMAQTRMAICMADPSKPDTPLVFVNRAFCELTGYDETEVLGRNCRFLQGPDTDPDAVQRVREAVTTEDVIVVEFLNYRKDGSRFWNALHMGPIYDETGKLLYYFGSQWNVSDVHTARADERHARMMARELSHRMKNMFAVIGGLVTVTGRTHGIRSEAAEINDRIRALGRAFDTTLDEVSYGTADLLAAVRAVLTPYDPDRDRIGYHGPALRVDANLVSTIGLALHEVATNAIKHGALSNETGRVELHWHETDHMGLVMEWIEIDGPVLTENTPPQAGAGIGIIETLLKTIGGSLEHEWRPDGLHARINIPEGTRLT